MYGFISGFSVLFHWSICLFLCQYHAVLITVALQYCLKSRRVMPPALFFLLRIILAILGLLWFHINFRIIYSSSVKNVMGNLIGIILNLYIALGSKAILTILILPIKEHGRSFHFFESSSISFINVLKLSAYKSFTSLVRFIPKYFIFLMQFLKGFVFLLSLSDISLLV